MTDRNTQGWYPLTMSPYILSALHGCVIIYWVQQFAYKTPHTIIIINEGEHHAIVARVKNFIMV